MVGERWTVEDTKRALYLYFQLPFGSLHSRNPEIITLAQAMGRTPSSIAMKLANFASLDPKITETGRKGLEGATNLDRQIWNEFNNDWTKLVGEAEDLASEEISQKSVEERRTPFRFQNFEGPSTITVSVEQRIGQNFFRRAVLANYDIACCVTGISDERLLNASHILPWSRDETNRHNPANGLCLSATFDRAFDRGLITVLPSLVLKVSDALRKNPSIETRLFFAPYEDITIRPSVRFDPNREFLEWHNGNCFIDA